MSRIIENTLYDLDDVTIVPARTTEIEHRAECDVTENGTLPIFVSPMDTVIGLENYQIYEKNNVIPVLPRTIPINDRINLLLDGKWVALSLGEYEELFCYPDSPLCAYIMLENQKFTLRPLIDIANGHINKLIDLIKTSKEIVSHSDSEIEVMVGNIANPQTFKTLADAGADYIRCSIGSGGLCLTSANCSVHYPMASLISECYEIKKQYGLQTKIIADGGISSYNRAIKALACGADYVMMGSVFGRCFESSGSIINAQFTQRELINGLTLDEINTHRKLDDLSEEKKKYYISMNLQKVIYGMSTKRAQKRINGPDCKLKTSEGLEKMVTIEYTLHQWLDNFISYLRSTMSYCNVRTLEQLRENAILMLMTPTAQKAFNK